MRRTWSFARRQRISAVANNADERLAMTHAEDGLSESEPCSSTLRSTDWSRLAGDIDVAARSDAPVLISGPADSAVSLARTIAAFGGFLTASDVRVRDCAGEDDVAAA